MIKYRLNFEPDDNGAILVTSPDFPPLVTYGENEEAAKHNALDAIRTLLESMMDAREPIPTPTLSSVRDAPFVSLSLQEEMKVRLYTALNGDGLTRADLQRRLGWQRESVDRLFRLHHGSKIDQMEAAFIALGRDVEVTLSRPTA
jgi:antitoxin HicB